MTRFANRGNAVLLWGVIVPLGLIASISIGWAQESPPTQPAASPFDAEPIADDPFAAPQKEPGGAPPPPINPRPAGRKPAEEAVLAKIPELKVVELRRGVKEKPAAGAAAERAKPEDKPEKTLVAFRHERGPWEKGEQILIPLNVAESDLPDVLKSIRVTTQEEPPKLLFRDYSVTVVSDDLRNQIEAQAAGLFSGSQFQINGFRKMLAGKEVIVSVRPAVTKFSLTIRSSDAEELKVGEVGDAKSEEPNEQLRGRVLGFSSDQKLMQLSKPAGDKAPGQEVREVPVDRIETIRVLGEPAEVITQVRNLQTHLEIGATTLVLTALEDFRFKLAIQYQTSIDPPSRLRLDGEVRQIENQDVYEEEVYFSGQATLANKSALDWKSVEVRIFHADVKKSDPIYQLLDVSVSRGGQKQFPLRFPDGTLEQKLGFTDIIYIAAPAKDGNVNAAPAPLHAKLVDPNRALLADEVVFRRLDKKLDSATKFLYYSREKTPFSFDKDKKSTLNVASTRASDILFKVTGIDVRNTFNLVGQGGRSVRYELSDAVAIDLCDTPVEIETGASSDLELVANPAEFRAVGKRVQLLPFVGDKHAFHVDLKKKGGLSLPYADLPPGNDPGQLNWLASRLNIPDGLTGRDVGQLNAVRTLINGVCAALKAGNPKAVECCGKTPPAGQIDTAPLLQEAKSVAESVKEEIERFLADLVKVPCRACEKRDQLAAESIGLRDLLLYVDEIRAKEVEDEAQLEAVAAQLAEVEREVTAIRTSRGNARSAIQNALAAEAHRLRLRSVDIQNRIDNADDKLASIAIRASQQAPQAAANTPGNDPGNGNSDVVIQFFELNDGESSGPIILHSQR
ncbi:hypothetical protein M4951_16475 [Blastopirellula sp. J2-11]|uniref:hypothetical protein n=1 Tax=Blastopirellula sp. J2-11 TaxID=2943192 RepID=UPI0021C8CC60|nr:hypothetical protein [Blastopirellula sp. J2-11]UUO04975.1 hypothetical protein M4951_16475 [Blastopirellula sp. J2-11]